MNKKKNVKVENYFNLFKKRGYKQTQSEISVNGY